jgi:hypothetical protein
VHHSQAKNARQGSGNSCGHSIALVDNRQISNLISQREKLRKTLAAIREVKKELIQYGEEGYKNAGVAVFCAAVLMTTDIEKTALKRTS